jgi:hypothetical protein
MDYPKEEIRDYLNKLIRQLLFIKSLDKQLKLISEWESPQRIVALNIGSHFYRLVTYSFNRTIMIELCKLFSDKEQKSIVDFLNCAKKYFEVIEPTRFNPEKQTRDKTDVNEYLKVIDGNIKLVESKHDIITNLKGHRDKILAHSDAKYFNDLKKLYEKYPLESKEIDDLISIAKEILECHHVYLLDSHLEIEVHSTSDVDTILWHTRGFDRVWHDKRVVPLNPGLYKVDDFEERLNDLINKNK